MKLKISFWRITWRYLIAALAILVVLGGLGFTFYITRDPITDKIVFAGWGFTQIFYLAFAVAVTVLGYILSLTSFYYKVEHDYFIVKRFTKQIEYDYKNIEFIDIETSKKKKQVIFYSKIAKMRYLLGDKDGVLLDTLIKKCKNTMTVEEFRRAHPEEKY